MFNCRFPMVTEAVQEVMEEITDNGQLVEVVDEVRVVIMPLLLRLHNALMKKPL